jgi:peptidoglycan/LPS O-acetylase OafA/YrhL
VILAPPAAYLIIQGMASADETSRFASYLANPTHYYIQPQLKLKNLMPGELPYFVLFNMACWEFRVLQFFAAGCLIFLFSDRLQHSKWWALVAFGGLVLLAFVTPKSTPGPLVSWLMAVPLAYLVTWMGLHKSKLKVLSVPGDYSYGVFLYGFPIQQAIHQFGWDGNNPLLNSLVAAPIVFALAIVSWHYMELPMMKARPQFQDAAGRFWARLARRPPPAPAVRSAGVAAADTPPAE